MYKFPLEYFTENFQFGQSKSILTLWKIPLNLQLWCMVQEQEHGQCQGGLLSPQAWRVWFRREVLLLGLDDNVLCQYLVKDFWI